MKRIFVFLLFSCAFNAALPAQQRWEATYQNGTYSDDITRMVQTAGGDYLAYLVSKETSTSPELPYIAHIAANGDLIDLDTSVQAYGSWPHPYLFPLSDGKTRIVAFWENQDGKFMARAHMTPNFNYVWQGTVEVPELGVPVAVDDTSFVVARKWNEGFKLYKIGLSGIGLWSSEALNPSIGSVLFDYYYNLNIQNCPNGGFFLSTRIWKASPAQGYLVDAKFNSDGIKEWAKWTPYNGGSVLSAATTDDAYYILTDGLLRKLDLQGNLVWQQNLGPIFPGSIVNGICAAGNGDIVLTGQKNMNFNNYNLFMARFNSNGNLIWEKDYGYDNQAELGNFVETTDDGGFIAIGKRSVGTLWDAFVVKTDNTGNNYSNLVRGKVFEDLDENCEYDAGEPGLSNQIIRAVFDGGEYYRTTDSVGNYAFPVGEGQTLLNFGLYNDPYAQSCNAASVNFDLSLQDTVVYDVAIHFIECPLLTVDLSTGGIRPCSTFYYCVYYCNEGNSVAENVVIRLFLNNNLEFVSAGLPYSNPDPGLYVFEVGDVQPGECSTIQVFFHVNCNVAVGTEICYTVGIEPDTVCIEVPWFAYDPPGSERMCTDVVNSYDPNDKIPLYGSPELIGLDSTLKYQIRFQNTGTDLAYDIVIRDTLSPNLEPLSIEPGAASHPYRWELGDYGVVKFIFENILLPDSTSDEPGSHGFVQFKIRQRPALARNTSIKNRAGIFFDFNPPIMTNTVHQKVDYPDHPAEAFLTLCAGETFNNHPQFADTTYVQTTFYPTFDSVVTTHLTVLPVFENTLDTLVPLGTFIGGVPVFTVENFTLHLTAVNGCDSTVHVHVAPIPGSVGAGLLAGDAEVCQFETTAYILPFHPDASYLWASHGGNVSSGQGTNTVTVNWLNPPEGDVSCYVFIGGDTIEVEPVSITIFANELSATGDAADPLCAAAADGAIDLSVLGGGAPFSYQWSNGATLEDLAGLPAGTYSVTVTSNFGCTKSLEITLAEPPALAVSAAWLDPVFGENNGNITLAPGGGTPPYQILWSNGSADNPLTGLPAGTYSYTITDAHDCIASGSVTLDGTTAAADVLKKYGLSISPNPASEVLHVVFHLPKSESIKLEVLDATGRRVAVLLEDELLSAGEHGLNVAVGEWAAGVYGLYFKGENGGSAIRFLNR